MIAVIKPKIITPVGWLTNKLIKKKIQKEKNGIDIQKNNNKPTKTKTKYWKKNKMFTRPIKICSHVALPL